MSPSLPGADGQGTPRLAEEDAESEAFGSFGDSWPEKLDAFGNLLLYHVVSCYISV